MHVKSICAPLFILLTHLFFWEDELTQSLSVSEYKVLSLDKCSFYVEKLNKIIFYCHFSDNKAPVLSCVKLAFFFWQILLLSVHLLINMSYNINHSTAPEVIQDAFFFFFLRWWEMVIYTFLLFLNPSKTLKFTLFSHFPITYVWRIL